MFDIVDLILVHVSTTTPCVFYTYVHKQCVYVLHFSDLVSKQLSITNACCSRYLLVEHGDDKDKRVSDMYLSIMRRFSQALMKVGIGSNYSC